MTDRPEAELKVPQTGDITAIDQALLRVGLYGEVHLVIENGRLRLIRTVHSEAVANAPERRARKVS